MEEMFTEQEAKKLALKYMKKLKIPHILIGAFSFADIIKCYDPALHILGDIPEYIMKQVPTDYQMPYACTYLNTEYGRMWNFLVVSLYKEDEEYNFEQINEHLSNVSAYIVNEDNPICSEGGTITVAKLHDGGLLRDDI